MFAPAVPVVGGLRRLAEFVMVVGISAACLSTSTWAHQCVHDHEIGPYHEQVLRDMGSVSKEAHLSANPHLMEASSRRMAAELQPRPLRIKPIFQVGGLDVERSSFLKDRLIPAAIDVLFRAVKVKRPVQGNLALPRVCAAYFQMSDGVRVPDQCAAVRPLDMCGPYATEEPSIYGSYRVCQTVNRCQDVQGGPGMPDADFVLYVTATTFPACSTGTIATAGFCTLDLDTSRPLAGFANFCPTMLQPDRNWGYQLDTAVHEILHSLVMSQQLFGRFTNSDGDSYITSPVGQTQNGVYVITTPRVKQVVQDHFDCPSAIGAALEDDGGEGTSASHWESRFFQNEIMQGVSNLSSRQLLSKLTLALLADSGWYVPDLDVGAVPSYGYKKGCSFLVSSCAQSIVPAVYTGYYCPGVGMDAGLAMLQQQELKDTCSWDSQAIAYCSDSNSLTGTCRPVEPYSNGRCSSDGNASIRISAVSFGNAWGLPSSRCLPIASKKLQVKSGSSIFTVSSTGASCWEVNCQPNGTMGREKVVVKILGKDAECPPGRFIDLATLGVGILEGVIGPCPEPEIICPYMGCPENCNSNGLCVGGACQCHVGWQGLDCAEPTCGPAGGDVLCQSKFGANAQCSLASSSCVCRPGTNCGAPSPPVQAEMPPPPLAASPSPSPPPPPPPRRIQASTPAPPAEEQAPRGNEEAPETPPLAEDNVEYLMGLAYDGSGYLQDCTVYLTSNGKPRGEWDPYVQTDSFGAFYLSSVNTIPIAVELPSGGSCLSSFVRQPPVMPLEAPATMPAMTPLSTLAMRLLRNETGMTTGRASQRVASLLGIPDASRVFTSDIFKLVAEGSPTEERALVLLTNLAGAIAVTSAWLSGTSNGSYERLQASEAMIMAITSNLISSSPISFVQPNNVIALLHGARDRLLPNQRLSVSVEEELQAVALTITRASRMLTQIDADHDSLDFLNHLIAFSQVVFTSVAADAGRLGAASQDAATFASRTSSQELETLLAYALDNSRSVFDMVGVPAPPPPPPAPGLPAAAFISTIKSYWSRVVENPWILAAAIGLATCVIVIVLVICCCCCCRRRRAEKSAQLRSQEDVVDAQRLARALELSMADQGCQRREPQTAELAQALSLSMAEPHMAVQPDDLALALELSLADQQGQRAREEPARAPELCMPFLNGPGNAPRPASPCPPSAPVWPGHGAGQV